MTPAATSPLGHAPRQARDVMAFGQEHGRVLSDGQIVGRAEPFAKVFPSSRLVKRAVGLTAWGILEDIALDAGIDAEGRLVAETSVRRIAANLGVNKETVSRHLIRLRALGFVLHEEARDCGSGRWETARYVLDPSACLERFTTTPPQSPRSAPCTGFPDTVNPDTDATVYGFTGHGKSVHPPLEDSVVAVVEEQQQHADQTALLERLGVDAVKARALATHHSPTRIRAAVEAATRRRVRNPAGWVIRALEDGWELSASAGASASAAAPPALVEAPVAASPPDAGRWQAWDAVVSAGLDDASLARAVRARCTQAPGVGWVLPAVRVELIRWAAEVHARRPGADLAAALQAALANPVSSPQDPSGSTSPPELPEPPSAATPGVPSLRERLTGLLPSRPGEVRACPESGGHGQKGAQS